MKHKLMLIIFLFCLTGCSAKYEVEIKNSKVSEKQFFIINKSLVRDDSIYYTVNSIVGKYFPSADFLIGNDTKEYYDKDKAVYQINNNYKISNYSESNIFGFCYDAYNVIVDNDNIMISTSEKFKCFDFYDELEDVQIIVKSNHKLKETNADEVDGYIYKWNLNEENADKANIYLKLHKDKYVFNYEHEFTKKICLVGGILLVVATIVLIFIKKRRNATKI